MKAISSMISGGYAPFSRGLTANKGHARIVPSDKRRNMLKSLLNSAWGIALTTVIKVVKARKDKKGLKLTILGRNRVTQANAAFQLTAEDIPDEIDMIGPKLLPIVMGYKFYGCKLETPEETILSVEINL